MCWSNSRGASRKGYKHILLDAPTGSGKSIIALVLASKLEEDNVSTSIITKTINLQKQNLESKVSPKLDNLYGKANYHCSFSPTSHYMDREYAINHIQENLEMFVA